MKEKMIAHPNNTSASEIAQLCNPLARLDISYFSHVRIDNDNNFSALCNHPEFGNHYIDKRYYNADIHMAKLDKLNNFVVWDAVDIDNKSAELIQEAKEFGHQHTFTLIEKNSTENNYYHFASNLSSKSINQTYLSNIDLLKLFVSQFKSEVINSKALQKAYDIKFHLDSDESDFMLDNESSSNIDIARKQFLYELGKSSNAISENYLLPTTRVTLIHKDTYQPVELTIQQIKCLFLLVRGNTAREIAGVLHLSSRTVEAYLENVKGVLGCKNGKELIAAYSGQILF